MTCLMVSYVLFCSPVMGKEPISVHAGAAVLMDGENGRVLYGKNPDEFLSNASTTKILTCIVTLERSDLSEIAEASAYAASMPKVKLSVKKGEHYRLEDLLYSLMLESHNDSAVVIAEHVGGSMEGFARMMNEKAAEIGCENSWFITPNGLDATQTLHDREGKELFLSHGTTARDLAKIMSYCVFHSPKADQFLKITRTASYSFQNQEGRSFSCNNHNLLLQMLEGALSGKTGFTNKAGYCYVGAYERNGKKFTLALLACGWPNHKTYKWQDSQKLFTYGQEHFQYYSLSTLEPEQQTLEPVLIRNGIPEGWNQPHYAEIELIKGELEGLLLAEDEKIVTKFQQRDSLEAPALQGEVVGCVNYMLGEDCIRKDQLVLKETIERVDYSFWLQRIINIWLL